MPPPSEQCPEREAAVAAYLQWEENGFDHRFYLWASSRLKQACKATYMLIAILGSFPQFPHPMVFQIIIYMLWMKNGKSSGSDL